MQTKKNRIQYVDQYRKISTVEKLPSDQTNFIDLFDERDKDNTKFMRYRKQPYSNISQRYTDNLVIGNNYVQQSVKNRLQEEHQQYTYKDKIIKGDISAYRNRSKYNRATPQNQKFKFFYGEVECPKKINEQSIGKKAYNIKNVMGLSDNKDDFDQTNMISDKQKQLITSKLSRTQYNFFAINQKRFQNDPEDQKYHNTVEDQESQGLDMAGILKKYKPYKDLRAIDTLNQNKILFDDFSYDLREGSISDQKASDQLLKKFIYDSVIKNTFDQKLDIGYFRDLGLPSWNVDKFTECFKSNKNKNQIPDDNLKEQSHLLQLLKQKQLNINKKNLNFEDISNVVTGRILSSNAYLCIRSQKVTKAQFQKLLKRLDKYQKQQRQKGKNLQQNGTCTDQFQHEIEKNQMSKSKSVKNQTDHMFYINQIIKLRGESAKIKKYESQEDIIVNKDSLEKQIFAKMQILLKKLYSIICVDANAYPYQYVDLYLDEPENILKEPFQDGKILWFIVQCNQDILQNMKNQDNLIKLFKLRKAQEPSLMRYKGKKLVKSTEIGSKQLYTVREKKRDEITPNKVKNTPQKFRINQTPTKQEATIKKQNLVINNGKTKKK